MSFSCSPIADIRSDGATPSIIWASVEISVGIICACLPTIQPFNQLLLRKIRDATSQRRTRRESSGVWYTGSTARRSYPNNRRGEDGTYGMWDEELTALHPAYINSELVSAGHGMRYGTEAIDAPKGVPVATIGPTPTEPMKADTSYAPGIAYALSY